jgi:hypothetical protein
MRSQDKDDEESRRKLDDPLKSPRSDVRWLTGSAMLENMTTNEELDRQIYAAPMMDWTEN